MIFRIWVLALILFLSIYTACSLNRNAGVATDDSDLRVSEAEEGTEQSLEGTLKELEKLRTSAKESRQSGGIALAQADLERALNMVGSIELENPDLYQEERSYRELADGILEDYKSLMLVQSPLDDYSQYHEAFDSGWDARQGHIDNGDDIKPANTMPLVHNPRVEEFIQYFTGRGRKTFSLYMSRGARYRPMIIKILREMGLPEELYYASMIESGFNPFARSKAQAVGPWQFIYGTGRIYGLEINYYLDERNDPEKSTRAAARFMRNLYREFQDWNLVLASYNCDKRRIYRSMERNRTRDFWQLRDLPRETMDHIPKIIAAAIIGKSPQKYGFSNIELLSPLESEEVQVKGCIDLQTLAECAGTDYATLRIMNPELHKGFTPPTGEEYKLKIPRGSGSKFTLAYQRLPESARSNRAVHIVKKGETIALIARRYGLSTNHLRTLNNLKKSSNLAVGQTVFVPIALTRMRALAVEDEPVRRKSSLSASNQDLNHPRGERISYVVKKGDTIGKIASMYGSRTMEIRSWNNMRYGQLIYPGQALVIYSAKTKSGQEEELSNQQQVVASRTNKVESKKDNSKIYIVRAGDTLWKISQFFGVSLELILQLNRMKSHSVIKPGDRLLIPD